MIKKRIITLFVLLMSYSALFSQKKEREDNMAERMRHEVSITKDPRLGYVPKQRLINANEYRKAKIQALRAARAPLLDWTERGPDYDEAGQGNGNPRPPGTPTAGRLRAILEDISDPTGKTVWVGGITGGLWKTDDITAEIPGWTPVNDFLPNLSISSICQDPTNPDIMYIATGEFSPSDPVIRGSGIWKSTDHGENWSAMPQTSDFWRITKMVCDKNGNIYAGVIDSPTEPGMWRYTKATNTWADITPSDLNPSILTVELSSTGRLHIVCGDGDLLPGYRYTDNPATVTKTTWKKPVVSFAPLKFNVAMASKGNVLYALPSNSSYQVTKIYKSTDGGANWAPIATTPPFTNGQAWLCLTVAIDPDNANNVIVGSLNCYKTTNGGNSWTQISEWLASETGYYVHADQLSIRWRSNDQVLIGCDGGIFYSPNGGNFFISKNEGLRLKQFYSVAIHPTMPDYFLMGAQDNGSHAMNHPGMGGSVEVTAGDGCFVHIDQNDPDFQISSITYNGYYRSFDGAQTWGFVSAGDQSENGQFVNPTDYDDLSDILYCGNSPNTFLRWNDPQQGDNFTVVQMPKLNSGMVSAVKVSPYTRNTVFFAGSGGNGSTLIKAINANTTPTFTSIIGADMKIAGAYISSVELGTNEQNIIVAFSNYGVKNLWVTSNGGTSWTNIDGNLPDMPVRWAMFYPGSNTRAIIATETGVWQTELINGASTVWDPETNFPNVPVFMLQYRKSDRLLAAATFGRGLFTTILDNVNSCGTPGGLNASSITATTATVSWQAVSGATSYSVDYKANSSSTWVSAASSTTSASVSLSGLSASTLYDWRVKANCGNGSSAYAQAQFTTSASGVCNAPAALTSSAITTTTATVSWQAVSGATSYAVDYKANSSSTWVSAASSTTSASVSLSGLSASTLYDWRVKANCSNGSSVYAQAQFTTSASGVCNAPAALTSSAITATTATVSWQAVSGATSYSVDYKANSSATWVSAATGTTSLSVNLSGLSSNTLYNWRVKTNCSNGSSAYAQAQFTTGTSGACSAPATLGYSDRTASTVRVTWSPVSGAASYSVDYKMHSSSAWTNAATNTTSQSVTLTNLYVNTLYDWRVKANCGNGSSAYAQAQAIIDIPPQIPLCQPARYPATSNITATTATVSWGAASGAGSYTVEYKEELSDNWIIAGDHINAISLNLSGLYGSTNYQWRVKSHCSLAGSGYIYGEFTTSALAGCGTPASLASSPITTTSVNLSWAAVSNASFYSVYYKLHSSDSWITAIYRTTSTQIRLNSLFASTLYDWRVKTYCAGKGTSISEAQFSTADQGSPCNTPPSGLAEVPLTSTSALLSWKAVSGVTSYDVDYKLLSSSTWIKAATATTSTSVTLRNLTGNSTTYVWRVRANCADRKSEYSGAEFVMQSNPSTCQTTTGIFTSGISDTYATLNFTPVTNEATIGRKFEYKPVGTTTWKPADVAKVSSTAYKMIGLTPSTEYDWRTRTGCNGAFSHTRFTTAPLCGEKPANLAISVNSATSFTLDWTSVANMQNVSYVVYYSYKEVASNPWIEAATVTTNSYTLEDLPESDLYYFKIVAVCNYNNVSYTGHNLTNQIWVTTTQSGQSAHGCIMPNNLVSSVINSSEATVSWAPARGVWYYDVEYKASTSDTWLSAAKGTTNTFVKLSKLNPSTLYQWRVKSSCGTFKSNAAQEQFITENLYTGRRINDPDEKLKVNLYPNPVSGILNVKISEHTEALAIYIYDADGRLTKRHVANSSISSFDMSNYAGGVYYLKIADNEGVVYFQQKFIKN